MLFFLRFMDKKYVDDFLKGKIFMKSNEQYIDLEKESNIKGIGDKYEGSHVKYISPENSEVIFDFGDGKKIPVQFEKMEISQNFENVKKFPILCSTVLDYKDFEVGSSGDYVLKKEVLEDLQKDFHGKSCVFISNFLEFKDRINLELDNSGLRGIMGPIQYFGSKHPLDEDQFNADPRQALFYKRDFYKYQREYRLVVEQIDKKEVTMEIGDISDIAFEYSSDDLDKLSFHIQN